MKTYECTEHAITTFFEHGKRQNLSTIEGEQQNLSKKEQKLKEICKLAFYKIFMTNKFV